MGEVDFIPRSGKFEVLAAAIVMRRIRWAEQAASLAGVPWKELPPDFAAILRHEINNPLTGILGNAELLLAHYATKLPVAAAQRVETVVDLAVRLREATRRLSNAVEMEQRRIAADGVSCDFADESNREAHRGSKTNAPDGASAARR